MNIIQITPGAGGTYCGNCLRDNALVAELRRLGHDALLLPMYLPPDVDEIDQSAGLPIFFGGINVYLEQKFAAFRRAPDWLRRWLAKPALLRLATGRAAKTRPEEVGDLTVSMLRGEEGNQARELVTLVDWLRTQRPDLVCLSNALLIGLARTLKTELRAAVVCHLGGEDSFLDSLPSPQRELAWRTLAERAQQVDLFIAPTRYFGELMRRRLDLPATKVQVVANGIHLDGFPAPDADRPTAPATHPAAPVLGYFARMCRQKGLDTLVEAYLVLRARGRVPRLRLRIGGSCGPSDRPFVAEIRERLASAGVLGEVEFRPNLDRKEKLEFLRSLTVFSVPAAYGEAFGLYLVEAMAAGLPVVQPRHAAFPELIESTGGGVLFESGNADALAFAVEDLLLNPAKAQALGAAGRRAVWQEFSARRMAENMAAAFERVRATQPATLEPA